MRQLEEVLWEDGEYQYEGAYGFVPELHGYLHEDGQVRPCVIVVPGGGYEGVSLSEGEIVALDFWKKGYQTFVCTYTTDPLGNAPLKLQPLKDLSRAVRRVRSRAEEFCVNPGQVAICGFSAGGHLCGSLCVHFADIPEENPGYAAFSNRPDAAILSYPVITSGPRAHVGSIEHLLGRDMTEEELRYMSLELQVTDQTPPCFLWHTETDDAVPVENSYLMAAACREKGVPYALHIFSDGNHGLSLSNDVWVSNQYGEPYTTKQAQRILEKIRTGELTVSEEDRMRIEELSHMGIGPKEELVREEVAVWPVLAHGWLRKVWGDVS